MNILKMVRGIISEVFINEAPKMPGVSYRTFPDDEMSDYLKQNKYGYSSQDRTKEKTAQRNNFNKMTDKTIEKDKRKFDAQSAKRYMKNKYDMPIIHNSNIEVVDDAGNVYKGITDMEGKKFNLSKLRDFIKTRPAVLLAKNGKMKTSTGEEYYVVNLGIPALRGLALDEETGDFIIVNTCPGAGVCKEYCFARNGSYVQWKNSTMALTRKLNFLINDPEGFEAQLHKETDAYNRYAQKKGLTLAFRWHDSGDMFADEYMDIAVRLAEAFPDAWFYAYTKMAKFANKKGVYNLTNNFSDGAAPSQQKEVDPDETKMSIVIPEELTNDIFVLTGGKPKYKDDEAKKELKKRLYDYMRDTSRKKWSKSEAEYVQITKSPKLEDIIDYDEMKQIPYDRKSNDNYLKYTVIVKHGDGDNSAWRRDVHYTLLVKH